MSKATKQALINLAYSQIGQQAAREFLAAKATDDETTLELMADIALADLDAMIEQLEADLGI